MAQWSISHRLPLRAHRIFIQENPNERIYKKKEEGKNNLRRYSRRDAGALVASRRWTEMLLLGQLPEMILVKFLYLGDVD